MLENIAQITKSFIDLDKKYNILDLFFSGVHNTIMNKRLNNAENAILNIKNRLENYGLSVNYKDYFEKQLKIPLMLVNALSEEDNDDKQEILQNLFIRHLSEKYDDDSLFPAFIHFLKDLSPLDVKILDLIFKHSEPFPKTALEYENATLISGQSLKNFLNVTWNDIQISIEHLLSMRLINNTTEIDVPKMKTLNITGIDAGELTERGVKETSNFSIEQQGAIQNMSPKLTSLGFAFMKNCSDLNLFSGVPPDSSRSTALAFCRSLVSRAVWGRGLAFATLSSGQALLLTHS